MNYESKKTSHLNAFRKQFEWIRTIYVLQIHCNTFQQQTRSKIHKITSIISKYYASYASTIAVSSCAVYKRLQTVEYKSKESGYFYESETFCSSVNLVLVAYFYSLTWYAIHIWILIAVPRRQDSLRLQDLVW